MNADAVVIKQSKRLPIVITWGVKNIDLGELVFLGDGSLVFESRFFSSHSKGESISFGQSVFKDNKFHNHPPDKVSLIGKGFHISLHPPKDDMEGVMHFRDHEQNPPLYYRFLDWFPVQHPFNLVHGFTLPLDVCRYTTKKSVILTSIDPDYTDSIEFIIDIFPNSSKEHNPYEGCIEVWGTCPEYKVRVSLLLAKQRREAFIYWPDDSSLVL